MMRENLTAAIGAAAEGRGYAFHAGEAVAVAARIDTFPAVWLESMKMTGMKGRRERTDSYRVVVAMMARRGSDDKSAERAVAKMERDAQEMCRRLAGEENVRRVYGVKCGPAAKSRTRHLELVVELEFDVEMFYCVR